MSAEAREKVELFLNPSGEEGDVEAYFADGFDDCIVGIVDGFGRPTCVLYDREKVIRTLIEGGIADYEGAVEYFEFNIVGSWVGPGTPMYMTRLDSMEGAGDG